MIAQLHFKHKLHGDKSCDTGAKRQLLCRRHSGDPCFCCIQQTIVEDVSKFQFNSMDLNWGCTQEVELQFNLDWRKGNWKSMELIILVAGYYMFGWRNTQSWTWFSQGLEKLLLLLMNFWSDVWHVNLWKAMNPLYSKLWIQDWETSCTNKVTLQCEAGQQVAAAVFSCSSYFGATERWMLQPCLQADILEWESVW